jgi:two-component system cell cycle response regulator DivK
MPKVLLVEDNDESRDALSRRLERRGYNVVTARNGEQGVAMAKSETPDIILMDMNMPILDGWQAARQLQASEETGHVAIIGLTAHAMSGDREKALAAGCVDYHTKPVDFAALLGQIEAVLTSAARDRHRQPASDSPPDPPRR